MTEEGKELSRILKLFTPRRIIWPILIGVGVTAFFFYRGFDAEAFSRINWTWLSTFWIFMAVVMMLCRQIAYMYRIRLLSAGELSWRKSFDIISLWEFGSAATPTVVGGSAVALFLLTKEKIAFGRTTAIVFLTIFLDHAFFILFAPLFFLLAGKHFMFPDLEKLDLPNMSTTYTGLIYFFVISYIIFLVYTFFIGYGLFINPKGFKNFVIRIFSMKILRRWKGLAGQTGEDVLVASNEFRSQKPGFWFSACVSTFLSWTARFFVVNCIILAFGSLDNHFIVYARQVVMWVILLVTPTPGGSGMAEVTFTQLLVEFVPQGLSASMAMIWRMLSYYPYLFLGAVIFPRWIRRVYMSDKGTGDRRQETDSSKA